MRHLKTIGYGEAFILIVTTILVSTKLLKMTGASWWWVLSPVWIYAVLATIIEILWRRKRAKLRRELGSLVRQQQQRKKRQ